MEKMKHEKERTEEEKAKADKKLLKKERQRKKKLEAAGIDYEFDGYVSFLFSVSLMGTDLTALGMNADQCDATTGLTPW